MKDLKDAKYQLKALFLRNNITCKVNDNWSLQHLLWLTELILPHPSQKIVLQEMMPGFEPVPGKLVGKAFERSVDGFITGEVIFVDA